MEGFHLFQERIEGKANKVNYPERILESKEVPYEFYEEEEVLDLWMNFKIEYGTEAQDNCLQVSDVEHLIPNLRNDIDREGKTMIILFYE